QGMFRLLWQGRRSMPCASQTRKRRRGAELGAMTHKALTLRARMRTALLPAADRTDVDRVAAADRGGERVVDLVAIVVVVAIVAVLEAGEQRGAGDLPRHLGLAHRGVAGAEAEVAAHGLVGVL